MRYAKTEYWLAKEERAEYEAEQKRKERYWQDLYRGRSY